MSNFDTALKILLLNEGGYNNDPNDKGGETYCGIARATYGSWQGWKIIDTIKQQRKIKNEEIINDATLNGLVKSFYQHQWQIKNLGSINNTGVASLVFDTSQQHGNWGRVVYFGIFGLPKNNDWYNSNVPNNLTTSVINKINGAPSESYYKIANSRKLYVEYLINSGKLSKTFETGILNRIKKFASNVWQFALTPAGGVVSVLLITTTFFF